MLVGTFFLDFGFYNEYDILNSGINLFSTWESPKIEKSWWKMDFSLAFKIWDVKMKIINEIERVINVWI